MRRDIGKLKLLYSVIMTKLMCPGHFEAENTHIQQVLMEHTDEGVLGTTDILDSEKNACSS